jgi:hypothetical protein
LLGPPNGQVEKDVLARHKDALMNRCLQIPTHLVDDRMLVTARVPSIDGTYASGLSSWQQSVELGDESVDLPVGFIEKLKSFGIDFGAAAGTTPL